MSRHRINASLRGAAAIPLFFLPSGSLRPDTLCRSPEPLAKEYTRARPPNTARAETSAHPRPVVHVRLLDGTCAPLYPADTSVQRVTATRVEAPEKRSARHCVRIAPSYRCSECVLYFVCVFLCLRMKRERETYTPRAAHAGTFTDPAVLRSIQFTPRVLDAPPHPLHVECTALHAAPVFLLGLRVTATANDGLEKLCNQQTEAQKV
ncbi:hypothetical protein DFH09DRAFT_1344496 [Mycena vulgaris]|nr:hypothetical protein DFH09DRAFT_1344496 [Mycena vulgaris]